MLSQTRSAYALSDRPDMGSYWSYLDFTNTSASAPGDNDILEGTLDIGGIGIIRAHNFGFQIPANAIINGFIARHRVLGSGAGEVDYTAYTLGNAAGALTSSFTDGTMLPNSNYGDDWAYTTLGVSWWNWGYPFTPQEVNSSDFSLFLRWTEEYWMDFYTVQVDHIELEVFYTPATYIGGEWNGGWDDPLGGF